MSIVLLWIATQIIAESFPISSSSHIKLLEKFFSCRMGGDLSSHLPNHFDELLHVANLVVLAVFFFDRWYPLVRRCYKNRVILFGVVMRTAAASSVTVVLYFLFEMLGAKYFFPIGIGLLITMAALFSLRWCAVDRYSDYTIRKACIVGFVQGVALLPGISRLASTYVVARWLSLSPRHAIEASFAMQVPLMVAAIIRAGVIFLKWPYRYELLNAGVGLSIIISSVVAYGALCVVVRLARAHKLWVFAPYMLVPFVAWLVVTVGGTVLCR